MRSLPDSQNFTQTIAPQVITDGTINGTAVQNSGAADARAAVIHAGAWTDGTHTFTFEDSPDGTTWTALTAAELDDPDDKLTGAAVVIDGAADDNIEIQIGLLSAEDYVRVVCVTTGSTTGLLAGASIQEGHPLRYAGKLHPMKAAGLNA